MFTIFVAPMLCPHFSTALLHAFILYFPLFPAVLPSLISGYQSTLEHRVSELQSHLNIAFCRGLGGGSRRGGCSRASKEGCTYSTTDAAEPQSPTSRSRVASDSDSIGEAATTTMETTTAMEATTETTTTTTAVEEQLLPSKVDAILLALDDIVDPSVRVFS